MSVYTKATYSGSLEERAVSVTLETSESHKATMTYKPGVQDCITVQFTCPIGLHGDGTSDAVYQESITFKFQTVFGNVFSFLVPTDDNDINEMRDTLADAVFNYKNTVRSELQECLVQSELRSMYLHNQNTFAVHMTNLMYYLSMHPEITQRTSGMLARSACLLSTGFIGAPDDKANLSAFLCPITPCINHSCRDPQEICLINRGPFPVFDAFTQETWTRLSRTFRESNGAVLIAANEAWEALGFGRATNITHDFLTALGVSGIAFACSRCGIDLVCQESGYTSEDSADYYDGWLCEDCYYEVEADNSYNDDDDEPDEDQGSLMSYGTNVLLEKESFLTDKEDTDEIFLGVELEVESKEARGPALRRVLKSLDEYCIVKSDGSLDQYRGMEIVSVPATLNAHKNTIWKEFFEDSPHEYLKGWNGEQCGMHVHIGRDCMSDLELGKLMVFINSSYTEDFITDIAGRGSSYYCRRDSSTKILKGKCNETEHYDALSISRHTGGATAELRIFRSNVNKIGFFKNLEFTEAAVRFVKQSSIRGLTVKNFLEFVMRDSERSKYQHLIEYLVRKRYVTDSHKPQVKKILGEAA